MGKTLHKPIIFMDLGGVYFTRSAPISGVLEKRFGVPRENIWKPFTDRNWKAYAEGRSDDKKFWKNVSEELSLSEKQAREFRKMVYNNPKPQEGMVAIVKRIRKRYRIVVFSSHVRGWVEVLEKKYKMSEKFHELHYTFDHGVDKSWSIGRPNAKFFRSVANKMKINPRDCIVIDDIKRVLDPIKKTGARTILFKDAKQLEKELRRMGVEI